jgi:transposase
MPRRIDDEERQKIIDLLHEHGGNRYKVAEIAKRSVSSVQNIAQQAGIAPSSESPHLKKAAEATAVKAETLRTEVLNLGFEKVKELLQITKDPQDVQRLAIAYGIFVDKNLVLSGKPNNINESRKGNEVTGLFDSLRDKANG